MKIVVDDLEQEISFEELQKETFSVDFGGYLIQFKVNCFGGVYTKNKFKVSNAMNGYGINCFDQFKDKQVFIKNS